MFALILYYFLQNVYVVNSSGMKHQITFFKLSYPKLTWYVPVGDELADI